MTAVPTATKAWTACEVTEGRPRSTQRARSSWRFFERPDTRGSAYQFESLDYPAVERKFNAYYAEFLPGAPETMQLHDHPGAELIYALQGRLSVHIEGTEHALGPGDSIYFDSALPHGYRRSGGRTCTAIVVTTP